jgi:hypothetical protein
MRGKRGFLSATALCLGLAGLVPGAIGTAHAQGTTYDRFSNSLMLGVADPGAIWVPDAGTYIGAVAAPAGDSFVLYGSPNLEDVFRPESVKFSFRGSTKTAGFTDPLNPDGSGQYFCSHGTPSFVLWKGKLYMSYQVNPVTDDKANNPATNPCGIQVGSGASGYFVAGPHYVMENNNPADPFCLITRTDGQKCWHAVAGYNNHPIGGRALSFLKRNTTTAHPELWAVWTTESVRIMKMDDPGTPADDPANPGTPLDPRNAVLISNAASTVLKKSPGAALTTWEQKNFRPYEYRHYEGDGTNEAPQGLVTKDDAGNEHVYITYSANTWQEGDYLVGLVEFTGSASDPLDKNPTAIDPGSPGTNYYSPAWSKSDTAWFDTPAPATAYTDPTVYGARHYTPTTPPPAFPTDPAPLVCGVGSNSFVKSPDLSEIWIVYGGRANCTYARSNQGAKADSVDDFFLVSPVLRALRIQRVNITNGVPSVTKPWVDGSLRLRPSGESNTTPPGQMLIAPSSVAYEVNADDSRVFSAGFKGDLATAGQLTSSKIGSYLMIIYSGASIKLTGPVNNNCPSPTNAADLQSCGKIEITVDGDPTKKIVRDISTISGATAIFNSTQPYAAGLGLTTGQHTLTVRIITDEDSAVTDESRVSIAKVTVTP